MASIIIRSNSAIPILTVVFALFLLIAGISESAGRLVGGRSEISDVKTNKEVQDLGRFSVEEYNRHGSGIGAPLRFVEVLAAERQVVAGIKYYLQVAAASPATENGGDSTTTFESVVIVKPWLDSKKLLGFAPAADDVIVNFGEF